MAKKDKQSNMYTQNRDLSWLKFNDRVLMEAVDPSVPLLERLKFVAIFTSNLDEFFMIRVGSLFDLAEIDSGAVDSRSKLTIKQQLDCVYKDTVSLYKKRDRVYRKISDKLREQGICDMSYDELGMNQQKHVRNYFRNAILPVLSPQIIDSHHPFPHLENQVLHIVAKLQFKTKSKIGIVAIPPSVSGAMYFEGNGCKYIRSENIMAQFVEQIFDSYTVQECCVIRVTRNADITLDEPDFDDNSINLDVDLRKKMQKLLNKRGRLAAVRLETSQHLSVELEEELCSRLGLEKYQSFVSNSPMKYAEAFSIQNKLPEQQREMLTYKRFVPQFPKDIRRDTSILKQVQKKDLLLSFPYESMQPFLSLIKEAAFDNSVISIKITIYRMANKTKLVEYLSAAAENGKDVTVLIELKARFDEQNNIDWSERLEEAGCKVIYGFEGYKVHSKICLITRKEKNDIKYITQIGTGNYNEKTATMYTDISLMTSNQDIGSDAADFFKNMGIGNLNGIYKHLLVAPISLKPTVLKLIDEQIGLGSDGRIFIKINSLSDVDVIKKLREASCAGVHVKMIIRGVCCIVPGVQDNTANIYIKNIVGRFLEHSRIYCFGSGDKEKIFISSADFMTRNTSRRVEVACPIYDPTIKEKIRSIMDISDLDNVKARKLLPSNEYVLEEKNGDAVDSQNIFIAQAVDVSNESDQCDKVNDEKNTQKWRNVKVKFWELIDALKS